MEESKKEPVKTKNNKRKIGQLGENQAVIFLKKLNYTILETNYYSRYGEIDLIAKDKETVVFVEVKYRKSDKFGTGLEAVSFSKIKSICKTAKYYLKSDDIDCRFDVISIDQNNISHVINAFEYID